MNHHHAFRASHSCTVAAEAPRRPRLPANFTPGLRNCDVGGQGVSLKNLFNPGTEPDDLEHGNWDRTFGELIRGLIVNIKKTNHLQWQVSPDTLECTTSKADCMPLEQRQSTMRQIEALRDGRILVCVFNFDRDSVPPVPGVQLNFASDTKEALFRVLKETFQTGQKIDLCLYTRGGDTNAVWPIASLIREFDPDFNVLVPFRCHSAGTLLALGSKQIVMTSLSELSPIDPSTGNQFNPLDEQKNRLAISVEDVQQYKNFILNQLNSGKDEAGKADKVNANPHDEALSPFLALLAKRVHPLALGNVHRVHLQINQLARNLLGLHVIEGRDLDRIIESLTTRFYSHLHMINRHESREILGDKHVQFADDNLSSLLDALLRKYEDDFAIRKTFFLAAHLKDEPTKEARFIAGAIESKSWSYLFETHATLRQQSTLPPNVQVQLPPGQPMPLIPGLPRTYNVEVTSQAWVRNTEPKGITT